MHRNAAMLTPMQFSTSAGNTCKLHTSALTHKTIQKNPELTQLKYNSAANVLQTITSAINHCKLRANVQNQSTHEQRDVQHMKHFIRSSQQQVQVQSTEHKGAASHGNNLLLHGIATKLPPSFMAFIAFIAAMLRVK